MIDDDLDWSALPNAEGHDAFADKAWLTFYLAGDPKDLRDSRPDLQLLSATNLDGEEGGMIYAKVPCLIDQADIAEKIRHVRGIAHANDIRIDIIDLDSTPDVERSKFFTLWTGK